MFGRYRREVCTDPTAIVSRVCIGVMSHLQSSSILAGMKYGTVVEASVAPLNNYSFTYVKSKKAHTREGATKNHLQ